MAPPPLCTSPEQYCFSSSLAAAPLYPCVNSLPPVQPMAHPEVQDSMQPCAQSSRSRRPSKHSKDAGGVGVASAESGYQELNEKLTKERERHERQQREAQEERDAAIACCLQGGPCTSKKYKKCPICMASVAWSKMQEHTETHLRDEARRDRIREERARTSNGVKAKKEKEEGKKKAKKEKKKEKTKVKDKKMQVR